MIQTDYSPDKFGTYLSHPESLGGGIDLSDSPVREIILAYRAYRRTLNPSFNNDHILRRVDQLEEEFNDTVITEVKVGGVVNRSEKMLRSQICQDIRAVHFL